MRADVGLSLAKAGPARVDVLLYALHNSLRRRAALRVNENAFDRVLSRPKGNNARTADAGDALAPRFVMLLVSVFCRSGDFLLYTLSEALVVLVVCARFELLDDGAGREAPLRVGRHNRGSGRNVVRLRSGFLRLDVDAEGVILRQHKILAAAEEARPELRELPVVLDAVLCRRGRLPVNGVFLCLERQVIAGRRHQKHHLEHLFEVCIVFGNFESDACDSIVEDAALPEVDSVRRAAQNLLQNLVVGLGFKHSISPPRPLWSRK